MEALFADINITDIIIIVLLGLVVVQLRKIGNNGSNNLPSNGENWDSQQQKRKIGDSGTNNPPLSGENLKSQTQKRKIGDSGTNNPPISGGNN